MYQAVIAVTQWVAVQGKARLKFVTWFVLGLSIGLLMVMNSQLSGDQIQLMNLGWQLSHNDVWIPHGMITSAGGYSPGNFSALLVGIDLIIWNDYRSPALFTLLLNAGAFLLLLRTVGPAVTDFGREMLIVVVWLSPWHLYYSAHLWDANYMFVFAVLHLVTARRMSQQTEFWTTAAHVTLLGLGLQIHTSAVVLCILSVMLWAARRIRVSWSGLAFGAAVCAASLSPWIWAVHQDPTLIPGSKGFAFRGLIFVFPLLRGVMYWIKLTSLSFVGRMEALDFTSTVGHEAAPYLNCFFVGLIALANITVLISLWLQWRFFRKAPRILTARPAAEILPRSWLRFYVYATCAAALVSFAASPTTIMFWQVFVALPASGIAMTMSAEAVLRSRFRDSAQKIAGLWACLSVILVLGQAVGAPMYRCGGSHLGAFDPMLVDLHARTDCLK
jgi:hypothetical protein